MSNLGVFDNQPINPARLDHVLSLGLDISNKRVLEVGAGVGFLSHIFLDRGCTMTITDGNAENVAAIRQRHPGCRVDQIDMDSDKSLSHLGEFDIVFCYGLLYHLGKPELALQQMADVCRGLIILETCVAVDTGESVNYMGDHGGNNGSIHGTACRPSRQWILNRLQKFWGHGYISVTQPAYGDFTTDWTIRSNGQMNRAIFVGSRQPLNLPTLSTEILQQQEIYRKPEQ